MREHGKIQLLLKAVWRREQLLRLLEGLFALLHWGVPLLLVGGLFDWLVFRWLFDMPIIGRAAILLVILGLAFRKAWLAGWKYLRPFDSTRTALQIEKQAGGMESLLVTALQRRDSDSRPGTSRSLYDLACRKAEEAVAPISAKATVRFHALRFPAMLAVAIFLMFGLVAVTNGPLVKAGLIRIFVPWVPQDYPTRTQLILASGDMVVQEGSPVQIVADIKGSVPRKAKIAIRTGDSKPRMRKVVVTDGTSEYRIETAYRGFQYRVYAGDARSDWRTVDVIPAPNIAHAEVTLVFPEYTKRSEEIVEALTVTVPETSTIKWKLSLDRAVREATMHLAGEEPVPLVISEDGLTVSAERVAAGSRAYHFSWTERAYGFVFTSPNHYLQVAPDRPPRAELTSPARNIYATLGRKLDLAFRGSDDHGVAESFICYQVDKTEEEKVPFSPVRPIDGTEQVIDWDYRVALTNLAIGQTVTFAVELKDAYPGENGPHLARTEARRMQFMSMEDYLAQVEKQRKRLLSHLRTTYKEERDVYAEVVRLDRNDPVFIQTCQLEAVRQDLMRDGLRKLADQVHALTDDLHANGVTNAVLITSLETLRQDVLAISSNHLSASAVALRTLASETGTQTEIAHAHAAHMVNRAARELGLLVLQLGFEDAADVMGREMHAAAETQAALRSRTMTPGEDMQALAASQERLGAWLTRLFAASPKGRESSITDALIEFTLTRIVKQMVNAGIDEDLVNAAAFIRDGKIIEAARIQTDMIALMLKGEFRLRIGAERETLARAMDVLTSQAKAQKDIRQQLASLDENAFNKSRSEIATSLDALHKNLQLLLMPSVPAERWKLFDAEAPEAPAVSDLLGAAEMAMTEASRFIRKADRVAAIDALSRAEQNFLTLAEVSRRRIAFMTQAIRIDRIKYAAQEIDEIMARLGERQLSILEKTEDAAADEIDSNYLASQQEALSDALDELKREIAGKINQAASPNEHPLALPGRLDDTLATMRAAVPLLRANQPDEAIAHQENVIVGLEEAQELLAEHGKNISAFSGMLAMTKNAERPSPYVSEIVEEQRDMYEITKTLKPEEMPAYEIPQKNLIHAVDAILAALDPVSHLVETGTVMLFAKEDMDAAGEALAIQDELEVLDAQDYIIETLEDLRSKVDIVVPKYKYLLEISEALYETVQEGTLITEAQRKLRKKVASPAPDMKALIRKQKSLKQRCEAYRDLINTITGLGLFNDSVTHMSEVENALQSENTSEASTKMLMVEESLKSNSTTLLTLMEHVSLVLAPPPPETTVSEEITFLQEVLGLAAKQKSLYSEMYAVKPSEHKDVGSRLRELINACEPLIAQSKQHTNPISELEELEDVKNVLPPANLQRKLVAAKLSLENAVATINESDGMSALEHQQAAVEALRHYVVEYAMKFVVVPGPPPPADPAPTEDFSETEDLLMLFMPGAVSGKRPSGSRLEWEVLGKRDRAALNENFARELPLEYRAILKDYYERLAR